MNIRIVALAVTLVCVAGVVAAWLLGAFDGPAPSASNTSSALPRVESVVPIPTTTSAVPSAASFAPPSSDLSAELKSIGYIYDEARGTWRARSSTGMPVFVLEGNTRVVQAQLGNLVCDAPPPFDQRPAALTIAIGGGMDDVVPANATAASPVRVPYLMEDVLIATFTCYRV